MNEKNEVIEKKVIEVREFVKGLPEEMQYEAAYRIQSEAGTLALFSFRPDEEEKSPVPVVPKIPRYLQVSDFVPEFIDKLIEQLKSDYERWGNTWLNRPKEGQELRTKARYIDYFDMFEQAGTPVPWMKIVGGALICWIRDNHSEPCLNANECEDEGKSKLREGTIEEYVKDQCRPIGAPALIASPFDKLEEVPEDEGRKKVGFELEDMCAHPKLRMNAGCEACEIGGCFYDLRNEGKHDPSTPWSGCQACRDEGLVEVKVSSEGEDILEKDCTNLVPPPDSVIDEGYVDTLREVMNISVDTPAETLRTLELYIVQRQIYLAPYAGNAFLSDDKDMMRFLKGQYIALEALRKFIGDKYLRLVAEQNAKEEKESYADYVKKQMATLKDFDHKLFHDIVWGLISAAGWKHEGGSNSLCFFNKGDAAIKVFRSAESPQVIKICFSAEPEEEEKPTPSLTELTEDAVKEHLDKCIDFWRAKNVEASVYYIDAYQSVRVSLFGELKSLEEKEEVDGAD